MSFARLLLVALLGACALVGCVGPQIRPDGKLIARTTRIHLVPMEVPPLSVASAYATTGSSSIVELLPRYNIGTARTVGVLSGIVLLLEWPEMSRRRLEYPLPVQSAISPIETWQLSVVLAQEAQRLVSAAGRTPTVSREKQAIAGIEQRERTLLMENWMAPIRAWYNDTLPSSRYAGLAANRVEAVAEIGISNYEIFAEKLLLQVHVKLIDPTSGRLIGRARASSFTTLPSMDDAFADDAKRFKESALRAGSELLGACLTELGVLQERHGFADLGLDR